MIGVIAEAVTLILLAMIAYTSGIALKAANRPKMIPIVGITLGTAAAVFLALPMVYQIPDVIVRFESKGTMVINVSTDPNNLSSVLKALKDCGGKLQDGYILTISFTENVSKERQQWFERKIPKVMPGVESIKFVKPYIMRIRINPKKLPPKDLPKWTSKLSKWITYVSGYVVTASTVSFTAEIPYTKYREFKSKVKYQADVSVLYNPYVHELKTLEKELPSPWSVVTGITALFLGLTALGYHHRTIERWKMKLRG